MEGPATLFGIAELANRHGVSLRTLRFYEQRGLLHPIRKGTERFYSPKDETRLRLILKGKRLGFTLQEIDHLVRHASSKRADADRADIFDALGRDEIIERMTTLEQQKTHIDKALTELKVVLSRMMGDASVLALQSANRADDEEDRALRSGRR